MKRRRLTLLIAFALLLSSCGMMPPSHEVVEDDGETSSRRGGTLVVPLTNFDSLNPLLTNNRSYYYLSELLYDRLFTYEGSGRMVPSLVEHVERSEDGKRVSLTLKKDVYWQDGTPITTADVAETFEAVKDAPEDCVYKAVIRRSTGTKESDLDEVAKAQVFDERNIDFEFDKAYANYMEMLSFPILAAHRSTREGMLDPENFEVVASGPFTVKKWEKNKRIFLEKNRNYHGNLPYIDEIKGLIFSDETAIRQAYDAGQVDLCVIDDYTWDRYRSEETSRVESYETQRIEVIALNTNDPMLQDRALRRAIDLSVNKQRIIDSLYLSQGTIANFFINPKLSGGLFSKEESYMSVDGAMALLEKTGYRDINGDGFRENRSGETFTLSILTNGDNHRMMTEAQAIAEDLKKVGLRAQATTVRENEPADEPKENGGDFQSALTSGNYQIAVVGMDFSAVPDLSAVLGSSAVGKMNISRYSDGEMDRLLDQFSASVDDGERKNLVKAIYEIFRRDVPYIPLVFKQSVLVTGPRVEGSMRPHAYSIYNGIEDIYIVDQAKSN